MKNITPRKEKSPNRVAYAVILAVALAVAALVGGAVAVGVYVVRTSQQMLDPANYGR